MLKPRTIVEKITPRMAETYLEKNTINRPLNRRHVNYLVSEINKGKWQVSTDSIGFNLKGELANGQHRLNAIKIAGVPVECMVTRGLHLDAFNVIDTGKTRGGGDILGANGVMNALGKAGIIAFIHGFSIGIYQEKAGKRDMSLDNQEILDFYLKNKNRVEEAYRAGSEAGKDFKALKLRTLGGMYYVLTKIDRDAAILFYSKLRTGLGMKSEENPVHVLRTKLNNNFAARAKYSIVDQLAWFIIAWNAFRSNKPLKKLEWSPKDGEFPKPI